MSKEYIEREALIENLSKFAPEHNTPLIQLLVTRQPTADVVERKRGKWLSAYEYALKLGCADKEKLEEIKKDKRWKFCNDCEQQVNGFFNFCPNCGADMRCTDTNKLCGHCDKTDGILYLSNPPKVRCTITGEYHYRNDKCDIATNEVIK